MTDAAEGATASARPPGTAAARFARLRDGVHARLTPALQRLIPVTMIGFAFLNGFTYAVDLVVLYVLDSIVHAPYRLAVTVGYVTALSLAFVLNRWLNFQSHGAVGKQTGRYVFAAVLNFVLFLQGLAVFLEDQGVPGVPARLIAGLCEAVFMYVMMRTFVFRQKRYE